MVDAEIACGECVVTLTYDAGAISPEKAERLGADFVDELRAIVVHAESEDAGALTPADVTSAKVDQATLDRVTAKAAGSRGAAADVYAVSPLQEGVLFHHLLAPGDDPYVLHGTFVLESRVDVNALERAFQALVDRHDVLRTSFVWEEAAPLQVVHRRARFVLERLDWTGVPENEVGARLCSFMEEDRRRGFDLGSCPLIRASVLRLADGSAQLVWAIHHVILDGWSFAVLQRELFAFYAHFTKKTPLELQPVVRVRSLIDWLAVRSDDDVRDDERFFRSLLAGVDEPTLLDPPPSAEGAWAEATHALSAELSDALVTLARTLRVTLSTVVHAAFAVVLARYTGKRDVLFGSITSGRSAPVRGVESIVGLLINAVPVRVRVTDSTVSEWLVALQRTFNELRSHEHVALTSVQEWSDIPKGQPLFEALLVFENYPVDSASLDAARDLGFLPSGGAERTHYPLSLMVMPGHEIRFVLSYDAHRFADAAVPRALAHLETALRFIVESPSARASDVPILGDLEKAQLLVEWNGTRAEYASDRCIHELFEEQVARAPTAVAVIYGNERLTYAELDERANRLAHLLRARGVGPESLVAFCLERGLEAVVAILGILKAGGAYVPIDPLYPADRRAYIASDSRARTIITTRQFAGGFDGASTLLLDDDVTQSALSSQPKTSPRVAIAPSNIAYVIYTSGSTGRPKGSVIPHANVIRLMRATEQWYRFGADDCWTVFHSFAFDFSVWEIWGALVHGGRMVVVPYLTSRTPRDFLALLASEKVTVLNQTPSAFQQLMAEALSAPETPPLALRWVIFGGEALDIPGLRPWFERFGDERPRLVNMYGITETTVHVTYRMLSLKDTANPGSLIGVPIPDQTLYVLDDEMNPSPIGVRGELYVGGAGSSRCYLGRPDLTAARFVPDPFSSRAGARLYRTGDVARRLASGDVEYLGRADFQVKIRGFRIEIGEIEAELGAAPGVGQATVIASGDASGDKRLVAYVIPFQGETLQIAALKAHLQRRLPDYMVPSAFVVLDALPLTPNGKVDRKALPAPDFSAASEAYVAPRSPLEESLAQVWREVLKVERAGIHDNFFALGGHSLSATRVVARANAVLHRDLTVRALLEHPTIAKLAAALETAKLEEGEI